MKFSVNVTFCSVAGGAELDAAELEVAPLVVVAGVELGDEEPHAATATPNAVAPTASLI